MAAIKLDENVPDSVGATLRQAGHDVHLARDEQLAGVDDEHVLSVARSEGRVLVSLDKDPFAGADVAHPPQDCDTAGRSPQT